MAIYELAHWIQEQKNKKYSNSQIKDYLLSYGYSDEVIDEAFGFIGEQNPKSMQMGQPPPVGGIRIGEEHYDLFSILSLLSLFFFPLLALPLGIISLKHIKHDSHLKGKVLAVIGVIFGSLCLLLIIAYVLFFIFLVNVGATAPS